MRITNEGGIGLPLAVWLIHDEYDYIDIPNYYSVTTLMKPLKQIILPSRIPLEDRVSDVEDYIARARGHAFHDSIEKAWIKGRGRALKLLGFPQDVIDRVLVNPTPEQIAAVKDPILIYTEQRAFRKITVNGIEYTIGGKFDFCAEGIVQDFKSTSAYSWKFGTRDDDHRLQLSFYRWIQMAQEVPLITEDFGQINYIFTDWQKAQAKQSEDYPQKPLAEKTLDLMDEGQISAFVAHKLDLIQKYKDKPEALMPECTDEELWRSDPKFKYFSDPEKAKVPGARSTKNFDTLAEANLHKATAGKGVVVTIPGEVKACGYCPAFDGCKQKDRYFNV